MPARRGDGGRDDTAGVHREQTGLSAPHPARKARVSRKRRASVWVQELELEGQRRIIQRVNSGKGRAPASSIPQPLIVKLHTKTFTGDASKDSASHHKCALAGARARERGTWAHLATCQVDACQQMWACVYREGGRGRPVPLRRGLLVFQHGTRPHSPPWPAAPNWTPAAALQILGHGQGQPQLPWLPLAVCPHVSHRLRP